MFGTTEGGHNVGTIGAAVPWSVQSTQPIEMIPIDKKISFMSLIRRTAYSTTVPIEIKCNLLVC